MKVMEVMEVMEVPRLWLPSLGGGGGAALVVHTSLLSLSSLPSLALPPAYTLWVRKRSDEVTNFPLKLYASAEFLNVTCSVKLGETSC